MGRVRAVQLCKEHGEARPSLSVAFPDIPEDGRRISPTGSLSHGEPAAPGSRLLLLSLLALPFHPHAVVGWAMNLPDLLEGGHVAGRRAAVGKHLAISSLTPKNPANLPGPAPGMVVPVLVCGALLEGETLLPGLRDERPGAAMKVTDLACKAPDLGLHLPAPVLGVRLLPQHPPAWIVRLEAAGERCHRGDDLLPGRRLRRMDAPAVGLRCIVMEAQQQPTWCGPRQGRQIARRRSGVIDMKCLRAALLLALLSGSPVEAHTPGHCIDHLDAVSDALSDLLLVLENERDHFRRLYEIPASAPLRDQYLDAHLRLSRAFQSTWKVDDALLDCVFNRQSGFSPFHESLGTLLLLVGSAPESPHPANLESRHLHKGTLGAGLSCRSSARLTHCSCSVRDVPCQFGVVHANGDSDSGHFVWSHPLPEARSAMRHEPEDSGPCDVASQIRGSPFLLDGASGTWQGSSRRRPGTWRRWVLIMSIALSEPRVVAAPAGLALAWGTAAGRPMAF